MVSEDRKGKVMLRNAFRILLLVFGLGEVWQADPGIMLGLGPLASALIPAGVSLLSGFQGASSARRQARAIEEANKPKPFWQTTSQTPWEPASNPLQDAIQEALSIHRGNQGMRPPPRISTAGIRGASGNLREIANAMRERAMTSQFMPQAQARALEMMSGTNPMVQSAFGRAENYSNPLVEMLQQRAMSGGGGPGAFNSAAPDMTSFLQQLMGGQRTLGQPSP